MKKHKLQTGSQEFTVEFKGCKRQLDLSEISLIYDKSDKHLSIYHSYNVQCAARSIKISSLQKYPMLTAQLIQWNLILWLIHKNIYYGNNMMHGTAADILLLEFLIVSIILPFKSSCLNWTIFAINPMKKYILTCETVLDIQMKLKNQAEMIQN